VAAFTRTFAFLQALGLAAGLLAVVAILLYLQARQRARVISYGLAQRMGLSPASHRRALALELALTLTGSLAIALALALLAARLVLTRVEPLASISPVPLFEVPFASIGAALVVTGIVSVVGGALADRSAARADLAEVMRLAD
jgi:preprotein translocase subunit SecY